MKRIVAVAVILLFALNNMSYADAKSDSILIIANKAQLRRQLFFALYDSFGERIRISGVAMACKNEAIANRIYPEDVEVIEFIIETYLKEYKNDSKYKLTADRLIGSDKIADFAFSVAEMSLMYRLGFYESTEFNLPAYSDGEIFCGTAIKKAADMLKKIHGK